MTGIQAFLRQAQSDFLIFELLWRQDKPRMPESHALHYLQMATEKLAKAALKALRAQAGDAYSHVAFSRLPDQICRRDAASALGWTDFRAYQRFLARAAPLFREIDELNPSVGPQAPGGGPQAGPNVEYPWRGRDSGGGWTWHAPADCHFGLLDKLQRSGDGAALIHLIRAMLARFEAVFR